MSLPRRLCRLRRMAAAKVMVVGAGYAGVLVAQRLAKLAGSLAEVTLVNPTPDFVERIRLHEVASGWPRTVRSIARWLDGSGASLRVGRVTGIDVQKRRVELGADTASVDHLVFTTGSATRATTPGVAELAFRLDSPAQALELARAAARCAASGRPLVVVGGGLTAIEVATELADGFAELRVVLVCAGSLGEGVLGESAIAHVRAALERRRARVIEHVQVLEVGAEAVQSSSGPIQAGAVVWAAGFVASPLAGSLGLPTDSLGRLLVSESLNTHDRPWIWSAGDAAALATSSGHAIHTGAPVHMACKTASPMAWMLANNLDAALRQRTMAPFRWADSGVCVSLGRDDGVIQLRAPDGVNTSVIRGRLGAWFKERVCRYTIAALNHPWIQSAHRYSTASGQRLVRHDATPQLPRASSQT